MARSEPDHHQPITGATRVLAILGRPVEHALSPLIHNAALRAAGLDAVFVGFSPRAEGFDLALRGLAAAGCLGLSVTIPFKTRIVPLLDALGPSAEATGAVNTVAVGPDGRLTGHNTDVDGVVRCLAALGPRERRRAVLLGAGGAARAVVAALERAGLGRLAVLNRTPANAEALASQFSGGAMAIAADALDEAGLARHLPGAELLVNATSVGMYPQGEDTPVPARLLHAGLEVIDAVYRPEPTRLCRDARAAGARAVSGVDWIIAQGVVAFRHWLGIDPDERAMRAALERFLSVKG